MTTCQIKWIDCNGNPTPDTNDAVGHVILRADGRRFAICREHLDVHRRARTHSGDCGHVTRHPDTWDFEPLDAPYREPTELELTQAFDAEVRAAERRAGWDPNP